MLYYGVISVCETERVTPTAECRLITRNNNYYRRMILYFRFGGIRLSRLAVVTAKCSAAHEFGETPRYCCSTPCLRGGTANGVSVRRGIRCCEPARSFSPVNNVWKRSRRVMCGGARSTARATRIGLCWRARAFARPEGPLRQLHGCGVRFVCCSEHYTRTARFTRCLKINALANALRT